MSRNNIYIYEDKGYENFLPLVYLKPVFDIRCGMFTFKERIARLYPESQVIPLSRFTLNSQTLQLPNSPTLFINGRAIIKQKIPIDGEDEVFVSGDEVVAFRCQIRNPKSEIRITKDFIEDIKSKFKMTEVSAEVFKYPWKLIAKNREMIARDYNSQQLTVNSQQKKELNLYGDIQNLYIGKNAIIEDGVYLNTENGPIYIGDNVKIRPPTIIDGPCYIGDGSLIDGAKIRQGTSIGKMCKIAGEVEETIFLDWSNKHHEGFVGHSYIGEWVNIGAGTTTSDLKNTYGTIKIPNPKLTTHNSQLTTQIDTGLIKLGAFIGDHTKTGIGTLFTTGSVIGIFCNIYGGGTFPKYIPSFSWGTKDKLTTHKLEKAIETAKICMSRRNVTPDSPYIERIKEIFKVIENERNW